MTDKPEAKDAVADDFKKTKPSEAKKKMESSAEKFEGRSSIDSQRRKKERFKIPEPPAHEHWEWRVKTIFGDESIEWANTQEEGWVGVTLDDFKEEDRSKYAALADAEMGGTIRIGGSYLMKIPKELWLEWELEGIDYTNAHLQAAGGNDLEDSFTHHRKGDHYVNDGNIGDINSIFSDNMNRFIEDTNAQIAGNVKEIEKNAR